MKPLRVLLVGSAGRMGQAILETAKLDPQTDIVAMCDQGDPIEPAVSHADVVIDFSHASTITDLCRIVSSRKISLVIGTTGHSNEQRDAIERCAQSVPVVLSSNYSVGVNALFWLTRKAARLLGADFDVEIIEMHHRMKKDAPSGTAKTLAQILRTERNVAEMRHGREGMVGERKKGELGIHSIRGGDVVGDHTVIFAGEGERLELSHRATSRATFAKGALRAAHWVAKGRPAGLYSMEDVLELSGTK
jgi:4-hydroxy-tetrahydrodipicolinate reductase